MTVGILNPLGRFQAPDVMGCVLAGFLCQNLLFIMAWGPYGVCSRQAERIRVAA